MNPPPISPNATGLPGISELANIVGALLTVGLIAAVAALVLSAAVWGVAHHTGNVHVVSRAKGGVVVACLVAALTGGAYALITFFAHAGSSL